MRNFVIAAVAMLALAGLATSAEARSRAHAFRNAEGFAQELKASGQFEIESSTLALQKSKNDDIKKFAQKMIDDHKAADQKLTDTLKQANLPEPKYATLRPQRELINGLLIVNGTAFDRKYVQDQIQAHREATVLLQGYQKHGDNDALKQLASSLLPTIQEHLKMAEELRPKVTAKR